MIKTAMVFLLVISLVLIVPFFSVGPSYEQVCADAARMYGITEDEYSVTFTKNVTADINGESYAVSGKVVAETDMKGNYQFPITIDLTFSRSFNTGVIFHEFAHAAQSKYKLDYGEYNKEQHAELLAFEKMWNSNYWWNAIHMLTVHTFFAKPQGYLVTGDLWNAAFTGRVPVTM